MPTDGTIVDEIVRSFNQRVIAAALGGSTKYTLDDWTDTSQTVYFE